MRMKRRYGWWLPGLLGLAVFLAPAARADGTGRQFRVATTFYPVYITTLNIAGGIDGVSIVNMAPPFTGCLHDYQFTPRDMAILADVDILVANGAGSEPFLEKILKQTKRLKVIDASRDIALVKSADGEINPHTWLGVTLLMTQTVTIAEGLANADPQRADRYRANAWRYIEKLVQLRAAMRETIGPLARKEIVTFHDAFPYFNREFGLIVHAVIEAHPGESPGASELAATITSMRKRGVKVIFVEPQYPAHTAEIIARETGARIYRLDPAVTGPLRADAYLDIMRANMTELKRALQSNP